MGASGWEYVVPYQQDIGAALDALRREVFAAGDFVKPSSYGDVFDLPEPGSVNDLTEQEQYWEFMGTSGTHSIIDVLSVVPAGFDGDDFGTIRLLSDAECAELYGAAQPGRADYESLAGTQRLHGYVSGGSWTSCRALGERSARRDRVLGLFRGLTSAVWRVMPGDRAAAVGR
jgi:hypothetical protein